MWTRVTGCWRPLVDLFSSQALDNGRELHDTSRQWLTNSVLSLFAFQSLGHITKRHIARGEKSWKHDLRPSMWRRGIWTKTVPYVESSKASSRPFVHIKRRFSVKFKHSVSRAYLSPRRLPSLIMSLLYACAYRQPFFISWHS